ncbi:hypothetical protein [uncultured Aquimarina sp.]|uniref:hypothetical protein n=1 Tax=uncultured Aquimarina sp. TaxID=575652 RepID=UPI002609D725|nr:hypothetical protein [uncultured Aquimarina sp.]
MKPYFLKPMYLILILLIVLSNKVQAQCTVGQPNISVQAEAFSNITIVEGTSTTLTSPISGSSYQWTLDGVDISGAKSSTLTITNFDSTDVGDYNVIVDSVTLPNGVSLSIINAGITDYDRDRQALVDLYNNTGGTFWTRNTNWLSGPIETWDGVTVTNCRVTGLKLSNNNLNGPIPASFSNLTALKRLNIGKNNVSGILDISTMPDLLDIIAHNNNLTDIIFGINPLLQRVYIYQTPSFIAGKIIDISAMRQLTDFRVQGIGLSDLIISGTYNNLLYLIIPDNQISGTLDISNMPNLRQCNVRDNQFTDFNFGTNPELSRLYFYNNPVTPGRTMDISGMRKLLDFRVQGLNLGRLIVSGTYNEMLYFLIQENQISGTLDISNMPNLRQCNARDNQFTNFNFGSNPELRRLYFYNNPLTPGLTMDISGMRKLLDFRVQGLGLSQLTMSGTYDEMLYFIIADNQIEGTLDISNMPNIRSCNARDNLFDGLTLPSNVFGAGRTLNNLNVINNNLHFDALLPYNSIFGTINFYYNPQRDVNTEFKPITNVVSVDVRGTGNDYTWTPTGPNVDSFVATVDGVYSCEVTNTTGGITGLGVPGLRIRSVPKTVTITSSRSTNNSSSFDKEFDQANTIKTYPNPTQRGTPIYTDVVLNGNRSIHFILHTISGQKIKEFSYEGKDGHNTFQLDSEGLSTGQYILTSEFGVKKVSSMIIIQ